MTTTLTIAELEQGSGRDLGASSWHRITQEQVNQFAEATGDRQWIHVDPEAAASGPFGGTVAHGYLTLALLPMLLAEVLEISDGSIGINYGIEKVRFPAPVRVGSEVRLHATLAQAERRPIGVLYTVAVTVEVEGNEKPALAGEVVYAVA
jgi:acyl dehydratase